MPRTVTVRYTGNLYSDLTHLQSGNVINTGAPTDNNGMGEAFSPTDSLAASLGAYVTMTMGMKAAGLGADLIGACAEVVKEMAASPRRVVKVAVDFYLSKSLDGRSRRLLEAAAHTCPAAQSLSTELVQELRFRYE